MNNQHLKLQDILSNCLQSGGDLTAFALESFAKEIDYHTQTKLLTKLILNHSSIAKRLEALNKELSQSREMLAEAQGIAQLGRWDIVPNSGNMLWSKSMYDILELDHAIPASVDLFFSVVHPDDLSQAKEIFNKMFYRHKPWTARYRILVKGHKTKWVHFRFCYKFDDKGNLEYYYGTIQDITEMKKIEDELAQYSQHLEQMVEDKVQEIISSQMATIYALIKLAESRDDETGAHIERTSRFCQLLARKLQSIPEYEDEVTDEFVDTIYRASPLHDIGKVGIPDHILLKPGKLTVEEFAIMKTHVQIGYDTLAKVGQRYNGNEFIKMGMEIALYHHEKWDCSGYVNGLSGKDIPLSARIMALSDVYDALRSKRVYKEAFPHEKSMEIIHLSKGSHFDPMLIDVFSHHQEEFQSLFDSIK